MTFPSSTSKKTHPKQKTPKTQTQKTTKPKQNDKQNKYPHKIKHHPASHCLTEKLGKAALYLVAL